MHPIFEERMPELHELCRRFHVERLALFGSAAGEGFDPSRSDLDFLVEYLPEAKEDYPDVYFELKAGLEAIFGRPADLVMTRAIRNSYFREEVEETKVGLYAA